MSLALIASEIQRFLTSEEPAVLCITGEWGIGKSYAWNHYLLDAQRKRVIALPHYTYVSLFGQNSLDELKYSIFENTTASDEIGIEPSLDTLRTNALAVAKRLGKKSLGFFQQLPTIKNHIGGLGPVWYLAVSRTIICIDDIERHGNRISLRDVFGLVTQLKEQKHCKVCLILNDEALNADSDKDFRTYFEKVIDIRLRFAPTPEEAASIALDPRQPGTATITRCCTLLGIANIRLIKKIEHAVQRIAPLLRIFHPNITKQAIQSIALFAWSIYEPQRAPALEFLNDRGNYIAKEKRDQIGPREAEWNALLDAYGFLMMDNLDTGLLAGLQNGYFDEASIREHAAANHKNLEHGDAATSMKQAWALYHDSFDDNQDQTLDAIHRTLLTNIMHVDTVNLSQTIGFFKELGRPAQAAEMLAAYIAAYRDNPKVFDLANHPFLNNITDLDLLQAFEQQRAVALPVQTDPGAILRSMAERRGWHPDDLAILATVPVDGYRRIFKEHHGDVLHGMIRICLQFRSQVGEPDDQGEYANQGIIGTRARTALALIASECPMNALRVSKYGIKPSTDSNG